MHKARSKRCVSCCRNKALWQQRDHALPGSLQALLNLWLWLAEFNKITVRTALGFIVMGFIGFFVKLIFIVSACVLCALPCWRLSPLTLWPDAVYVSPQPINQIIVGGAAA